jgi:hypothetical protein
VGVTGYQAILLRGTLTENRRAIDLARESVELTRESLLLTQREISIAAQSNELTRSSVEEAQRSNVANELLTRESNATARAATELTRQSLVLSHRPKLVALGFYVHGGTAAFREGVAPEGVFRVTLVQISV